MLSVLALLACASPPPSDAPEPPARPPASSEHAASAEQASQDPVSAPLLTLIAPLEGQAGTDWMIQNHVDHDPGPGDRDFRGTDASYDGHKGTDFRIRGLPAMVQGVAVLAPAAGQVLRVRDGQPDRCGSGDLTVVDPGLMCGNGMVIDHGGGFQTQLCHLRKGSVSVAPGDRVEAGDPVGLVGWSGKAEFPHVHLKVLHDGDVLDPFAPAVVGPRAEWQHPDAVPAASHIIWATGFTDALDLDLDDIQIDPHGAAQLPADADGIAGYVMGLVNHGDIAWKLVVESPSGRPFVKRGAPEGLARSMRYTGKRRMPGETLELGTWTARLEVSGAGVGAPQVHEWSVEVVPGPVQAESPVQWEGCVDGG